MCALHVSVSPRGAVKTARLPAACSALPENRRASRSRTHPGRKPPASRRRRRGSRLARRARGPAFRRLRAYQSQGRRLREQRRAEHGSGLQPVLGSRGPARGVRRGETRPRAGRGGWRVFLGPFSAARGRGLACSRPGSGTAGVGVLSTVNPARVAAVPPATRSRPVGCCWSRSPSRHAVPGFSG